MPKKNVNKNENDPRAARPVRDIKNATMELIAKKPFRQIRSEEIIELATVNFKTFYRYYSSKADVLDDIREDIVAELSAQLETLDATDLEGGIRLFYNCINTDEEPYEKLYNEAGYEPFFEQMKEEYFSQEFFRGFCADARYAEMIPEFIGDAAVGIYRCWQKKPDDPKKQTIDELAEVTARILMGGLTAAHTV